MPHKNILFPRRKANTLWRYDTETQKWTQDTHYEKSCAGCKIFSLPWNHQRMHVSESKTFADKKQRLSANATIGS